MMRTWLLFATAGNDGHQAARAHAPREHRADLGHAHFLDPPFRSNMLEQALPRVVPLLKPGARVYVESAAAFAASDGWRVLRHGRAGQVHFTLVTYGD